MSQPGSIPHWRPAKERDWWRRKGAKKEHSQAHGDPRMEAHRDGCAPGSCCSQDGKCEVDNPPGVRSSYGSVDTVSVCRSCQHLYAGNVEVVLSPACLEDHLPHPDPANPRPVSVHRPWAARKYEGLCDCGASVSGGVCTCSGRASRRTLQRFFSCETPCLQKLKVAALVLAAIIPWVFLVTYIVLTSI